MAAEKQTVGLKLDPELAVKFKELQGQAGSAQDFVKTLLSAYAQAQKEADTSSPIYKEGVKVRQAFAQAERVVTAYLELAANDKAQAQASADEKITIAQQKVVELKDRLSFTKDEITELKTCNADLKKQVESLESQIESLDTLKASWTSQEATWKEKETGFVARIGELDAEAKTAQDLKNQITDLEKQLSEKDHQLSLVKLSASSDKQMIKTLNNRLDQFKTDYDTLKNELDNVKDALTAEKLSCAEKVSAEKTTTARSMGKLEQQIATLNDQLDKKDAALEFVEAENTKLKSDLSKAFEKALEEIGEDYQKLKAEQSKKIDP